jgi:hypothetical protein
LPAVAHDVEAAVRVTLLAVEKGASPTAEALSVLAWSTVVVGRCHLARCAGVRWGACARSLPPVVKRFSARHIMT